MRMKKMARLVTKSEGKKHQASLGDVREILSILSDLAYKHPSVLNTFKKNGVKRASRQRCR